MFFHRHHVSIKNKRSFRKPVVPKTISTCRFEAVIDIKVFGDLSIFDVEHTKAFKVLANRLIEALASNLVKFLVRVDAKRNDNLTLAITKG